MPLPQTPHTNFLPSSEKQARKSSADDEKQKKGMYLRSRWVLGKKRELEKRKKASATASSRALLQKSLQSITAGIQLNLSAGAQLAQGRAGLGCCQPHPKQGLPSRSCCRPAESVLARHKCSQTLSPVCFHKSLSKLLLLQELSHRCKRQRVVFWQRRSQQG